jgi:hypothetical protein
MAVARRMPQTAPDRPKQEYSPWNSENNREKNHISRPRLFGRRENPCGHKTLLCEGKGLANDSDCPADEDDAPGLAHHHGGRPSQHFGTLIGGFKRDA